MFDAIRRLLKSKTDKTTYEHALLFARGIYLGLDERWNAHKLGNIKRDEMRKILKNRFPSLTEYEIWAINKDVSFAMKSRNSTGCLVVTRRAV